MTIGIWILGDQLNQQQSALLSCALDKESTPVILIESRSHARLRPYHKQKLVLVWSAMRHFARELTADGWRVTYKIDEDFLAPLKKWIEEMGITQLRLMMPNDRSFLPLIQSIDLGCRLNLIPNNHFLWSREQFKIWADGRKRLILEDFYRESRKRFKILIDGAQPVGGKWNFDKQNRQPPKGKLNTPAPLTFTPDEITSTVIEEVKSLPFPTYGELESFGWGVTREQALEVLEEFITERLPLFGPYQDAMVTGEFTLWHGLISPYLNIGLITPLEVVERAEKAYYDEGLEINSVEGFIRQVMGWREYMYGVYHYVDADYFQSNWFNHTEPLPDFYWDSNLTQMNCLRQCLSQVEVTGYGHHIQRLMVLNNFALIAGVAPGEIENWFHSAFIDAYDWVMQTNVLGMGQFADGGLLASKPYAASANYINKMSDYCKGCAYDKNARIGDSACPFNTFYWDFLIRHRSQLQSQGRINIILGNIDRIPENEITAIRQRAEKLRRDWPVSENL